MASDVTQRVVMLLVVDCLTFGLSIRLNFTDIRLVSDPSIGSPINSGRVEVQLDSSWLDVCDREWNDDDGVVACRQLGYPGFSQTNGESHFGQGTNEGSVNRFRCTGDESSLSLCDINEQPSPSGCDTDSGAGLICTQPGYIGCYRDNGGNPVFAGGPSSSDGMMTISMCLNICRQTTGMQLAGLEDGTDCYCGGASTMLTGQARLNDKECRDVCPGNKYEVCGRSGRLSVYNVTLGYCTDPGVPSPNGTLNSTDESFHFGSVVTFDCDEGFELMGAPSIQCVLGDSPQEVKWTDRPPSCRQTLEETTGSRESTVGGTEEGSVATETSPMATTVETVPTAVTDDINRNTGMTGQGMETTTIAITLTETTGVNPLKTTQAIRGGTTGQMDGATNGETDQYLPGKTVTATTASPGGLDEQRGLKPGAFAGLAIGCILFILCACLVPVCLLIRRRKHDKPGAVTAIPLCSGIIQHSAVYGNSDQADTIPLKQPEQFEDDYVDPNPAPAHTLDINKEQRELVKDMAGKLPNPYLELDLDGDYGQGGGQIEAALYSTLEPDSSAESSVKPPEINDATSDDTGYFTVEDRENAMGNAQYCTGVVGDRAKPHSMNTPPQSSDTSQQDDNVDDHYYSCADPTAVSDTRTVQNQTSTSHPIQAIDDVYTYADAPEHPCALTEQNVGENQSQDLKQRVDDGDDQAATIEENEYAYVAPAGVDASFPSNSEEGWVENTLYATGPPV